jgi:hypothetical protein
MKTMCSLALTGALALLVPCAGIGPAAQAPADPRFAAARANGVRFEQDVAASRRVLHAWLAHADPTTLLLPDRPDAPRSEWVYTPHNSGADLYPYLILTAELTDPGLYRGRMLEMLRNEVRYTSAQASIPGDLRLETGALGPPSLFGAGEYAKDGLIAVTEYLGRTPWFYRMVDLVADAMARAPIESRFGRLPAKDAELNGDYLQALVRLAAMTGDPRFLEWGRRLADAYVEEVLPGTHGVPASVWDFTAHAGDARLRLRDHGNETVVGLTLQYALEHALGSARAERSRPAIGRMLDRIIQSANPDGMLYNEVNAETLVPVNDGLSDNWGYVYGAVYTFYMCTGETKYRDAVRRVLGNLPKYRNWKWEPSSRARFADRGSFDGYADAIESAIYLYNREPVAEALDWIDSEMAVMLSMQRPDGHLEDWYGEGNFNRTALLHAYLKSQGVRQVAWAPGMRVGAVREGNRLLLSYEGPGPAALRFDSARHRRVLNFDRNYVRLNEFPEWFTADENTLYRVRPAAVGEGRVVLGSELIAGIVLEPGDWTVEPLGEASAAGVAAREAVPVASDSGERSER